MTRQARLPHAVLPPIGRPQRDRQRGQAVIELALLLPSLLLVAMGTVDFGRGINAWIVMQNAAREGAFFAAQHPSDAALSSDVKTVVLTEAAPLLNAASVTDVTVTGPTALDGTILEQTQSVTVTYAFHFVTPVLNNGTLTLGATASAPEGP